MRKKARKDTQSRSEDSERPKDSTFQKKKNLITVRCWAHEARDRPSMRDVEAALDKAIRKRNSMLV